MNNQESMDTQAAGTGFMLSPLVALAHLKTQGYDQNIVPCFDHLEAGKIQLLPHEFTVDSIIRFENTSDPDDQAILYAISSDSLHVKGVFMESYGLYHEEYSQGMLRRLQKHHH